MYRASSRPAMDIPSTEPANRRDRVSTIDATPRFPAKLVRPRRPMESSGEGATRRSLHLGRRAGLCFARIGALVAAAAMLAAVCGSASEASSTTSGNTVLTAAQGGQPFTTTDSWGPTSWSYNPFVPGYFTGFGVQLTLTIGEKSNNRSKEFNLLPQLVSSVTVNPKTDVLTMHLVKGAKFTNGEPVNAMDVIDTYFVQAITQNGIFLDFISNMTAPNPTTVVVTPPKSAVESHTNLRGGAMSGLAPQPMSEYGQFLPPGMKQKIVSYYNMLRNPATAAAAQKSSAYKSIEADYKKLEKYDPKKVIGDGPFILKGVGTATATEVKSPTYFGASKVHVRKLQLINTVSSTAGVYPLLYSHGIDWYGGGTPSSTDYSQWMATPGAHAELQNMDTTENLLFNNKKYPFTLTPVRQAIAYLINRKTLAETEDGGKLIDSKPDPRPDGLGTMLSSIWLSASQRAELNPYRYSPSKATKLLKSVGFHKVGGHWMTPRGPFTTQVVAPSVPESAVLFAKEVAAMLSSFGIKATASTVPTTSYTPQENKGDFQIAWANGVAGNLNPVCGIAQGGLGSPTNYSFGTTGAFTAGEPGIGFGPSFNVPGQGTVKLVSYSIDKECQDIAPGPKLAAATWDWAQVANRQLPFLTYADDNTVIFYSTFHYVHWPPKSSYMWQVAGIHTPQALLLMIEHGYISPK